MSTAGIGGLGAAGGPGGGHGSVAGGGATAERAGALGEGDGEPAGSPGDAGGRLVACGRRGPGGRRGQPEAIRRLATLLSSSVTGRSAPSRGTPSGLCPAGLHGAPGEALAGTASTPHCAPTAWRVSTPGSRAVHFAVGEASCFQDVCLV